MPDKEMWINGVRMLHGTNIKVSKNTSTTTTTTFDEVISDGTGNISYSIDCGRVSYENRTDYETLRRTIDAMLDVPGDITIREVHRPPAPEPAFTVVENYHNCIVDGGDHEIKPDTLTVENLKFKTGNMDWYTE